MLGRLRLLTAGESHGPRLTAVLDGFPAGVPLDPGKIDEQLARRQRGFGSGGRMKIERDQVRITAGWMNGRSTGGPLALEVDNLDHANWKDKDIAPYTIPRPGHADLTGAIKYGHRELRLCLERASARETAARVAAGGACRQLLEAFGIELGGYARQIGGVVSALEEGPSPEAYRERFRIALDNDLACAREVDVAPMRDAITTCKARCDTLGGTLEAVALGLPPGLGSYAQWDARLDARIGGAMLSIPAMKGVELGPAFENAARYGTEVQDPIVRDADGNLLRSTNRCGGLEGGITTGQPLVVRVAMKPLSTTVAGQPSVDLATGEATEIKYERSDFCAVPRAVPIAESMLALVLADALLEKLGGDGLDEMLARFATLRRARLSDLPQDGSPWRFYPR